MGEVDGNVGHPFAVLVVGGEEDDTLFRLLAMAEEDSLLYPSSKKVANLDSLFTTWLMVSLVASTTKLLMSPPRCT